MLAPFIQKSHLNVLHVETWYGSARTNTPKISIIFFFLFYFTPAVKLCVRSVCVKIFLNIFRRWNHITIYLPFLSYRYTSRLWQIFFFLSLKSRPPTISKNVEEKKILFSIFFVVYIGKVKKEQKKVATHHSE